MFLLGNTDNESNLSIEDESYVPLALEIVHGSCPMYICTTMDYLRETEIQSIRSMLNLIPLRDLAGYRRNFLSSCLRTMRDMLETFVDRLIINGQPHTRI